MPTRGLATRADTLVWLLAVGLGLWLRWQGIGSQVVADDEWHSLYALLHHGWWHVATHFGTWDYCIPQTLLLKLLYVTVGLDEVLLRALPLAVGCAAIVLLPAAVRPALGPRAASCMALCLAIAPLAVLYSRFARPYAVSTALAFLAVACLWRWYRLGSGRSAPAAVACAALASWFHLLVLPFVATAFLAVWILSWRRDSPRSARAAFVLGGTCVLALLALLGPPLLRDLESMRGKSVGASAGMPTWATMLSLFAGSARPPVVLAVLAIAQLGLIALWRRERALVALFALAAAAQVAAVSLSGALFLERGIVFARYLLPLQPVLLLLFAVGLDELARAAVPRLLPLASLVAAAVLLALGPLPSIRLRTNDWTSHALFQDSYELGTSPLLRELTPARVSDFYSGLAAEAPGSVTIIETPYLVPWSNSPYALLQTLHHQHTLGGIVDDLVPGTGLPFPRGDPRARFATLVYASDLERVRATGARFLVLHVDLAREFPRMELITPAGMEPVRTMLRAALGQPCFADAAIEVWALQGR